MAQIIAFLKIIQDGILPHQQKESISTTNLLFRIHTKYVSTALLVTGTLLFIQQLFIDHLKCIRPSDEGTKVESQPLNQFCYTKGTYVIRNESNSFFEGSVESVTHFHPYFQWVPYILIMQGISFHLPQLVWNKFVERGKLASFCSLTPDQSHNNIDKEGESPSDEIDMKESATQTTQISPCVVRFANTLHSPSNKRYFSGFLLCEILNILMVLVSILTTEWFLGGRFLLMGPRWISYLHRLRTSPTPEHDSAHNYLETVESGNPLEGAFPSLFTCHWNKPMSEVVYVIPCVLAQNVTHQRIYLMLWLTFLVMLLMSLSNIFHRVRIFRDPKLRFKVVERHHLKRYGQTTDEDLRHILEEMTVYDWFILKRILLNVKAQKFGVILQQVKDAIVQSRSGGAVHQGQEEVPNNGITFVEMQPIYPGSGVTS